MFLKFLVLFLFLISHSIIGSDEIQNCEVEYYEIQGDSAKKILKEMKSKNNIEGGFFGYTKYSYQSKCANITTTCKVRIPKWIDFEESENEELKSQWSNFYQALVLHEQGHVNIFWEFMEEAKSTAQEKSCSVAKEIYFSAFKELSKKQKKYDKETNHGVKNGAVFGSSEFQAIAFSQETGKYGFAKDSSSREQAEKIAMEKCEEADCKISMWSMNTCSSLAVGDGNGYGSHWAKKKSEAQTKALNACKKFTTNCKVLKTVCPTE
ncbi:MAG: DUF4189 domain-containing protein [Leptospiraceae bacterium]|nr:DUF4189 domain-containing protein [Leptospiraceae bacterium]